MNLLSSETKKNTEESIFTLMLCHNTSSSYNRSEDVFKHEFSSDVDRLQIEFIEHYDYKFVCSASNKSKYVVEVRGNLIEVPLTVT